MPETWATSSRLKMSVGSATTSCFLGRVDAAINLMHSAKKAVGVEQILVPGEREYLMSVEQKAHGIGYRQAIVDDLNAVAGELGIAGLTQT